MNFIREKARDMEILRKRNGDINTSVDFFESQLIIARKIYEKLSRLVLLAIEIDLV